MPFNPNGSATYKHKITVVYPGESGKLVTDTFWAKFKRVDMNQIEELRKLTQKEVMAEVLVGWEDLIDDDKKPIEFTPENREGLFLHTQGFTALVDGFWGSIYKAREKNS